MNSVYRCKAMKENIVSKYFRIFGNLQQFSLCCLDESYIQHQMSDSPFTFGGMFYIKKTREKLLTFMLEFLFLQLS